MANAKRKCRYCKEYKRVKEGVVINNAFYCNHDHAYRYGIANKAKAQKVIEKENRRKKREFYDNDLRTRKAAAKTACHAYIRARDKGELCICCGEPLGENYDAGHFLESGNNPKVRYDERNIHGQRYYCNRFKGGDSGDYENNLRLKIGDNEVDELKSMKGGTVKWTAEMYREIEEYFKDKLKQLEREAA